MPRAKKGTLQPFKTDFFAFSMTDCNFIKRKKKFMKSFF